MEKTTRDIRREAIEAWIDHTKDWDEHDYHYADPKDSFIEGAEWAWRKALREAAELVFSERLMDDTGDNADEAYNQAITDAVRAIHTLAEGGAS